MTAATKTHADRLDEVLDGLRAQIARAERNRTRTTVGMSVTDKTAQLARLREKEAKLVAQVAAAREAEATPNPVVRSAVLRACPGWLVREYADGTFDAAEVHGVGLSPGLTSWAEAFAWVRAEVQS